MITNLFIPEAIGSYYLLRTRRAGIEIAPDALRVTVIRAHGTKRTIEAVLEEPLPKEGVTDEAISKALRELSTKWGAVQEISCVLPSSLVIFKELSLPFIGMKKAQQVVPFEIEAQLPFPLDAAVIDSIATKEDIVAKTTHLLVAAVQKQTVARYIAYFQAADLTLSRLTVDMIELYKLYELCAKPSTDAIVALIDIQPYSTQLAVSVDQRLAHLRALPRGLFTGLQTDQASVHTLEEALGSEGSSSMKQNFTALLSDIQFTLDAYRARADAQVHIVIMGGAAESDAIISYINQTLTTECSRFQPQQIREQPMIQESNGITLTQQYMVSLAAALKLTKMNFNQEYEAALENRLLYRQLMVLAALCGLILVSCSLYSLLRVRALKKAYQAAQAEAIADLQKSFKLKPTQTVNLAAANKAASTELNRQESAWNHLSQENRYALLTNLTALSSCLNAKESQLDLTSVVMKDDTIKLYGSVPGYPQLTKLQKQLDCPPFKKLPKLQDWNFKTEPITLIVEHS